MAERERRVILADVQVRSAEDDKPMVSGYAAMFNEETVIAGLFREQIAPGAFAEAVKTDDVRALWNHDPNVPLGRTKSGTLTLAEDTRGLKYDVVLNPDDTAAMDVRARILRGDVDGSSFGFVVEEDAWEYPSDKTSRALPLRTIKKASLFDVSPVTFPAYEATSVSARSKELAAEADRKAAEAAAQRAAEDAAKPEEIKTRESLMAAVQAAKAWRQ